VTDRADVEIILVGSELLRGERGDRHLEFLGRALRPAGVRIARAHTVEDRIGAIADLVRERAPQTRVLIVTGGLGPTDDDITRDGVADAAGAPLQFDEPTWGRIVEFFAARGRTPTDVNRRQAMFPRGAEILGNALGTAPGFHVQHDGAHIFVLPGPPGELQAMFHELVFSRLTAVFGRPALRSAPILGARAVDAATSAPPPARRVRRHGVPRRRRRRIRDRRAASVAERRGPAVVRERGRNRGRNATWRSPADTGGRSVTTTCPPSRHSQNVSAWGARYRRAIMNSNAMPASNPETGYGEGPRMKLG
jgi:molybdenum cofactor synthesis domain-containing protein